MNKLYKCKQKTSALLMTLVVIMISIAIVVMIRNQLWVQLGYTKLAFDMEDLQLHALGAESWAIAEIKKAHLYQTIPFTIPKLQIENKNSMKVQTQIMDLQSLWDVNHLSEGNANIPTIIQKMSLQSSNSSEALSQQFLSLQATQAFMGQDGNGLYVPSQVKTLFSVSEKQYRNWLQWTWVLPERMPKNLNTASLPVLMTLGEGLTESEALLLIEEREKVGLFSDVEQLASLPFFGQKIVSESELTLLSEYYLIRTLISKYNQQYMLYTMIKVQKTDRQLVSKIIWRMTHM